MPFTLTPNMSLPVPVVGSEPGPQFATDINNSLTIVDGHDHTPGSGVLITPAAINISSALSMNAQALIAIGALTFQPVLSDAASNSLYEKGVDLYYRDGSGNIIRITQSGSVTGSAGTITGLPSGTASASFAAGVFTFQAATNTAANIDAASYVLRNNTAGSHGLTLAPPNAMGADYSLTLPSLPGSKKIMTLDTAGNINADYDVDNSTIEVSSGTIQVKDQGITAPKLAPKPAFITPAGVGQVSVSPTTGLFNTSSSSFVTATSAMITTSSSGRPIKIMIVPDGTTNPAFWSLSSGSSGQLQIVGLSGTVIARWLFNPINGFVLPFSAEVLDYNIGPNSTVNYLLQLSVSGSLAFENYRLVVYEI